MTTKTVANDQFGPIAETLAVNTADQMRLSAAMFWCLAENFRKDLADRTALRTREDWDALAMHAGLCQRAGEDLRKLANWIAPVVDVLTPEEQATKTVLEFPPEFPPEDVDDIPF